MDNEQIDQNELREIRRHLELQEQMLLESLARQDRVAQQDRILKVQSVRNDLRDNINKASINALVCGVGTISFMAFAQVACQKLGLPNVMQEMYQNHANFMSNSPIGESSSYLSHTNELINYIQTYVKTVFGLLNNYLTMENIKSFVSEVGPVGNIAGLISVFSAKNVVKNLKEWRNKCRELDVMRRIIPNEVNANRRELGEFSLNLMGNSIGNSLIHMAESYENVFNHIRDSIKEKFSKENIPQSGSSISPKKFQGEFDVNSLDDTEKDESYETGRSR